MDGRLIDFVVYYWAFFAALTVNVHNWSTGSTLRPDAGAHAGSSGSFLQTPGHRSGKHTPWFFSRWPAGSPAWPNLRSCHHWHPPLSPRPWQRWRWWLLWGWQSCRLFWGCWASASVRPCRWGRWGSAAGCVPAASPWRHRHSRSSGTPPHRLPSGAWRAESVSVCTWCWRDSAGICAPSRWHRRFWCRRWSGCHSRRLSYSAPWPPGRDCCPTWSCRL